QEHKIYLKLETVQPAFSFKSRGIGFFVQHAKDTHGPDVHVVVASGGNAGLAAACAANALDLRCTVFIPAGATQTTVDLLQHENAEVVVGGISYSEALRAAKQVENAVLVPAFEDPIVWQGHSSLILEASTQLNRKPSAIFCSVGGAGLLGGIILGAAAVGWQDVPIVTVETIGSDCFYHSMVLNRQGPDVVLPDGFTVVHDQEHNVKLAHQQSFSSRASGSLGASSPAAGVVKLALERPGRVICVTVPDELSMQAACAFADDHKLLVELACSTTLVPAYKKELLDLLVPGENLTSLFIVCGGFKVSLSDMFEYRTIVDGCRDTLEKVYCDGQTIEITK
ncbi:tryptophan synthase beta subunit-like PLP-dependent enzyme, partial [Roridomyces roridus]